MAAVDYRAVIGFISDQMGTLIDVDTEAGRLERLIYKAAGDVMSVKHMELRTDVVDVVEGLSRIPCHCVRLLRVVDMQNEPIKNYSREGANEYIRTGRRNGQVKMIYYGMPVARYTAEDGVEHVVPLLSDKMIDYCGWYAICVLIREEVARQKFDKQVYGEYAQEKDNAYYKAIGNAAMVSIDEMEAAILMLSRGQFLGRR
jgi:hypothetical protein